MDFTRLTAGPDDADRRLDVVLRRILPPEVGLSRIYKALRCGLIKVDGKSAAPATRLQSGNELSVASILVPGTKIHVQRLSGTFSVIFENDHLCVLNKPAGVSSQAKELRDFLASREDRNRAPSLAFTGAPLHRLDRETTGVLVCSRSIEGARWFSAALKGHLIGKTYLGIAEGHLNAAARWEDALESVDGGKSGGAKIAVTTAAPLSHGTFQGKAVTLVSFAISTGRRHQIRAQCQIHGAPLLGDTAYGGSRYHVHFFLHALCVTFPPDNPLSLPETVEAPLPAGWETMLLDCGMGVPAKPGGAP
jgi:23S rRNA pseudouridine955/2504/2580 synthase